ncbi:MAG: hemerythrin domain-containing protein [candidate division NC10 bacterium]|nr:hemerythrin domain-containing protein [candidate division NC10 bacterium]
MVNQGHNHGHAKRATEALKHDHRIIERVLRALERSIQRLEEGQPFEPSVLAKALDFFQGFADKCHHKKEEDLLFPLLSKRGVPVEGGPIGVMLSEHEDGRRFLKGLKEGLDKLDSEPEVAKRLIVENGAGYIQLLQSHIFKEDNVLFVMADHVLGPDEQARLSEEFEHVEHHHVGHGVHERYLRLAEELEALV